jgi:antitoxin (DNA-binding transcriptional repressor) of toxin-antitoxin stability system
MKGVPRTMRRVSITDMRQLDLADIPRLAAELQYGETIELVFQGKTVAKVQPVYEPSTKSPSEMTDDEWLDELERQGRIRRGTGKLPDWFFTRELPQPKSGSVLQQLLDDRKSRDW